MLAARHARRLAQELDTAKGIPEHGDRLISTVLGNEAMSMTVFGPDGNRVIEHNIAATFAALHAANEAGAASGTNAKSGAMVISALPPLRRIPASARITEAGIGEWTARYARRSAVSWRTCIYATAKR